MTGTATLFLMETQGIMSINQWTMLFTLVNLVVLMLILKKFLYKLVKKMFAQREEEVRETYARADEANDAAQELKTAYEAKLAGAKEEAAEILSSASRKASQRSEETIRQAHEKAQNIMEKADEQIVEEKKKAVNELKNEISDLALSAAGKVIEKELSAEDHEKLIDSFIENVGDAQWQD